MAALRCLLLLLLTLALNLELKAKPEEPLQDTTFTKGFNGWFTLGLIVGDFEPDGTFTPRPIANFFGGMYFNDWLSVNVGAGIRVNDGHFVVPFYGGLRYADLSKEISPHLLLSGGLVTNPELGSREGPWVALVQAGIQFNMQKVGLTVFLSYENIPLYEKRSFSYAFYPSRGFSELIPKRFQLLSAGLTFSF